jgi:vacuolar-type H+-ATPase subunit C/Vma6
MTILLLLSTGIGIANMYFDLKRDVARNEGSIRDHKTEDNKKWEEQAQKDDKWFKKVDDVEEKVHSLELQNTRIESNQKEILRRLEENRAYYEKSHAMMIDFIKNFEVL